MLKKSLKHKFKSSFKWNIFGSFFYEFTKIGNQLLLIKAMTVSNYGLMASIFSIIYLSIYLAELGVSQSIAAFLSVFIKNKTNFKTLFIKKYLLPQIGIFSVAAIITTFFYKKSLFLSIDSPYIILIPLIILFEGLRIFLRRLLHNIFISKKTIILESILMSLFLCWIWIPHFLFGQPITLNLIFIPYAINSVIAVLFFTFFLSSFYKKLPTEKLSVPVSLDKRVLKTRFLSYFISVGKNLFTGNFLTPFFAATFGYQEAGIFNLANHIAESIKAITKSTIIFSGGGLFAKLKSKSISVKKRAFKMLCDNLNKIIYPVIIFITVNYKLIFNLKESSISQSTATIAILFFLMTSLEYFFMAYEQFYIVEEQTGKLLLLKLFEFGMFYIVITSKLTGSPIAVILNLIIVKLISFATTSINSYYLWKLKPIFKVKLNIIIFSFLFSLIIKFFF